jgi:hypothetical protein
MSFDRTSVLNLALGAALTLGTVACGDNRASNERRTDQPAASEAAREGQQPAVRTDNPEDVKVDADVRTKGEGAGVSGSARVGDKSVSGRVGADVDAKTRDRDTRK